MGSIQDIQYIQLKQLKHGQYTGYTGYAPLAYTVPVPDTLNTSVECKGVQEDLPALHNLLLHGVGARDGPVLRDGDVGVVVQAKALACVSRDVKPTINIGKWEMPVHYVCVYVCLCVCVCVWRVGVHVCASPTLYTYRTPHPLTIRTII